MSGETVKDKIASMNEDVKKLLERIESLEGDIGENLQETDENFEKLNERLDKLSLENDELKTELQKLQDSFKTRNRGLVVKADMYEIGK